MENIGIALYYLFDLLIWIIIIKSILTWFPDAMGGKIYNILQNITDPIEKPIRSIMYKYSNGPIDFSPMIAILALMLLQRVALVLFY